MEFDITRLTPELIEDWIELLADVQKAGGRLAMIGGGAVRDTLLGIPVSDIDVFYEGELDDNKMRASLRLDESDPIFADTYRVRACDPDYDVRVERIVDVHRSGKKPINLLQCESVAHRFTHFAANISKVFFTADGLVITPDFAQAVRTKTVTLDSDTSSNYEDKMREKFAPRGYSVRRA